VDRRGRGGAPLASAAPACLNDAIGRPHVLLRGPGGDGLTGGEDASRAPLSADHRLIPDRG